MSTYVTLAEVKDGTRDSLLEPIANQDLLDRAEQHFIKLVKKRGLTADDVVTPVSFEVTEYIISTCFWLCAQKGQAANLAVYDQQGSQVDPYVMKLKYYKNEMALQASELSREVITQIDTTSREREAIDNRIYRG